MRIYIFWFMSMVSVNFFAPLKESFLWEMFAKWAHKLLVCCEIIQKDNVPVSVWVKIKLYDIEVIFWEGELRKRAREKKNRKKRF